MSGIPWDQLQNSSQVDVQILAWSTFIYSRALVPGISLKTVDSHKTAILGECQVAWSLPEEAWLDYHFLHDKFGPMLDELFPV
jgi:hypothetical protein